MKQLTTSIAAGITVRTSSSLLHHYNYKYNYNYIYCLLLATAVSLTTYTTALSSTNIIRNKVKYSGTVTFPPYATYLSQLKPGQCATSTLLEVSIPNDNEEDNTNTPSTHKFCVLCYPRGGGHNVNSRNGDREAVGIYLQYIAPTPDTCIDVTFSMQLKGKQNLKKKFDLGWDAGMRFVSTEVAAKNKNIYDDNLRRGLANDFGAHLMQSQLLPFFLGVDDEDDEMSHNNDSDNSMSSSDGVLEVQVNMTVHNVQSFSALEQAAQREQKKQKAGSGLLQKLIPRDIRQQIVFNNDDHGYDDDDGSSATSMEQRELQHNTEQVRVGKIIVPVIKSLSQRARMFEIGSYPGVEYRIMRIIDPDTGEDLFGSVPGAEYEIKPIYPLVKQLERQWPARVNEKELPTLLTAGMYNFISAVGSLATAITGLMTAYVISLAMSLYFIPSKSMEPNLKVGDVLLVEKVSSKLSGASLLKKGDVVLFPAPSRLQDVIVSSGGKRINDRDLFVKRIAATAGDVVQVEASGSVQINGDVAPGDRQMCDAEPLRLIEKYIESGETVVDEKDLFVMGDCSDVSVDSRVWGTLNRKDVVGRPLLRVWPLERFGGLPSLPDR
mmetsp:Transcript_27914/g.43337  ORF Transcript_27914/g.43337 Transcript_27914/m.43337 type:complete len:607 (-) Transcript_27914:319-2139(-)